MTLEPRTLDLFEQAPAQGWRAFKLPAAVRAERTGWRDQAISERHRQWGANCPAVDLDFVLAELHLGEPVAIVEYKHWRAAPVNLNAATYAALRKMADRSGISFLVARYWPESWAFRVMPVNVEASRHFTRGEDMTEQAYVAKLYRLRQLTLSAALRGGLNAVLPPAERRSE